MQVRGHLGTATRPLLLIVALFCALAIGLTAVLTLRSQTAPTNIGLTQPFAFDQERPGPDSTSYKPKPIETPHMVVDPGGH